MKTCNNCQEVKKSSEFYENKNYSDGLCPQCKSCCIIYQRVWRKTNRKQYADYQQAYREANLDNRRAWHKTHSKQHAIYSQKYRKAHRKQIADYDQTWCKANPDKKRSNDQRYRAKKRGVDLKKFSNIEIFERDGWMCGICGQKINRKLKWPHPRSKSLDHIVPLSRGGAHIPQNVQAAHLRCNLSKHAGGGAQLKLLD